MARPTIAKDKKHQMLQVSVSPEVLLWIDSISEGCNRSKVVNKLLTDLMNESEKAGIKGS